MFFREEDENNGSRIVVELNIKNVMDRAVGSVVFEAVFSDANGNVIDTVEQKVASLAPDATRTVRLVYKEDTAKPVGNYNVKVRDIVMVPRSAFSGNDMVLITKHGFKYMDNDILEGLECGIKNISDKGIATLIIECTFFRQRRQRFKCNKNTRKQNLLPG